MRSMRGFIGLALCAGLTGWIVAGCTGATGPAGPKLSGTLTGFVYLVNATGGQDTLRDSVKVFIEGMADTAFTNSAGLWSIPGVETGIYTIDYHKDGYGDSKSVQVQFVGGGPRSLGIVYLVAAPTFSPDSLAWIQRATKSDSANVQLLVKLSDATVQGPYRLLVVLGHDSTLSNIPSLTTASFFVTASFQNGIDTSTNVRLTPATFATEGFTAGDSVWVAVYAANEGSQNSGYVDPATEKTVYTCINPTRSNLVHVLVP